MTLMHGPHSVLMYMMILKLWAVSERFSPAECLRAHGLGNNIQFLPQRALGIWGSYSDGAWRMVRRNSWTKSDDRRYLRSWYFS